MGLEGEGSGGRGEGIGVKGGGKWGERGREVGVGYPPVHPLCIRDFLLFDMQHDYVLEILNFDLLTPPSGSGNGAGLRLRAN